MGKHNKPAGLVDINYNRDDEERIAQRVAVIMDGRKLDSRAACVWEVISRYEGESGLSESNVSYLTSCVLKALDDPVVGGQHRRPGYCPACDKSLCIFDER